MRFHVETMTCGNCVKHVTEAITAIDPGAKIEADIPARTIDVATAASPEAVTQALAADGYEASAI